MHELRNQILELLETGEQKTAHIVNLLGITAYTARKHLNFLIEAGKVEEVTHGVYDLHENYKPLSPLETRKIVKDLILFQSELLTLYREDLKRLLQQPETPDKNNTDEKHRLLECIKVLSLSIDRLLKRWNLMHQGYDANTRQAHEDAKQKTADREQQALKNAPPEAQLKVVQEYDESMREILENMPHAAQQKNSV